MSRLLLGSFKGGSGVFREVTVGDQVLEARRAVNESTSASTIAKATAFTTAWTSEGIPLASRAGKRILESLRGVSPSS